MQTVLEAVPNDRDLDPSTIIMAHAGRLNDPLIEILADMLRLIAEYEQSTGATQRAVQ